MPSSNFKQFNILNKILAETENNLKLKKEDNPKVLSHYQLLFIYTKKILKAKVVRILVMILMI